MKRYGPELLVASVLVARIGWWFAQQMAYIIGRLL
jgi:hypothetical protein